MCFHKGKEVNHKVKVLERLEFEEICLNDPKVSAPPGSQMLMYRLWSNILLIKCSSNKKVSAQCVLCALTLAHKANPASAVQCNSVNT